MLRVDKLVDCLEIWELHTPGTLRVCTGVAVPLPYANEFPRAARSKAWECGHPFFGIAVSNSAGGMCFVLWDRAFCVGLITHPEESTECGVSECDREAPYGEVMPWNWVEAPQDIYIGKGKNTQVREHCVQLLVIFFFQSLIPSRFHPSPSLLITYYSYKPFP